MKPLVPCAVLLVLLPVASLAQTSARETLFGGDTQTDRRRPAVDFTVSLAAGRDDDLQVDQGMGVSPSQPQVGGRYSVLDAAASTTLLRPRMVFRARVSSAARHYPTLDSFVASSHTAAADLTVSLGRRTSLRSNVDGEYLSQFAFDALPRSLPAAPVGVDTIAAGPPVAGFDGGSPGWAHTDYGGSSGVERMLGRRLSAGLTGGVRHSERTITGERLDERSLAAHVERGVSRGAVVGVVYTVRQGRDQLGGVAVPLWAHDGQVSLQREWRHSAVRRTAMTASAGPSIIQQRGASEPSEAFQSADGSRTVRELRMVGTVALVHDIGRTWHAQASYRRGAGLRDAVLFSNTASVDLRGAIGRRLTTIVTGGYTDSDTTLGDQRNRYGVSFGSARLQFAWTRFVALYGQYFLYRYTFGGGGVSPSPGRADAFDRRGLHVGITAWAPLRRR